MSLTLTLAVADLERTAEFYGDVLGLALERFVPAPGHAEVLILLLGDATVLFRQNESLEALHPALFQNLARHPRGVGMTLELPLENLQPVAARIFRQKRHVLYELEDDEFDRRELWLHDPDGYLLILSEPGSAEKT